MNFEIVAGIGLTLLTLIGGIFGVRSLKKHGAREERAVQARQERDHAVEEAENASKPPLTGDQSVDALRRLRDD